MDPSANWCLCDSKVDAFRHTVFYPLLPQSSETPVWIRPGFTDIHWRAPTPIWMSVFYVHRMQWDFMESEVQKIKGGYFSIGSCESSPEGRGHCHLKFSVGVSKPLPPSDSLHLHISACISHHLSLFHFLNIPTIEKVANKLIIKGQTLSEAKKVRIVSWAEPAAWAKA